MHAIRRLLRTLDRWQQAHAPVAFPIAVVKKFGDDRAGRLGAQIAYYGFFSIFPLLLVSVSILGFLLADDARLRDEVLDSSLARFPVVGDQIRRNIGSLQGSVTGIVVGTATATWAGLAIVRTLQEAMNQVWEVPRAEERSFFPRNARALGFLLVVGTVIVAAAGANVVASELDLGSGFVVVVGFLLSFGLNVFVFLLVFRFLTVADVSIGDVVPGAVIAAAAWFVLQLVGTSIVSSQISKASSTYGTFAIVIGLLFWLHLGAKITLYAAEVNVVRTRRLWPRSLTGDDRRSPVSQA